MVVGGFTMSKKIVWSDPSNIESGRDTPSSTIDTGCYNDEPYTCPYNSDGVTGAIDATLRGVAYIFRAYSYSSTSAGTTAQEE
jgi:hypothetical protein